MSKLHAVLLALLLAALNALASSNAVIVLPVTGTIDSSMLMVFRRAFREAKSLQPAAVILELNTPGGAIDDTKEIIAWIRATRQGGCPVYAWVHPDALSAGALISLACDGIYMSDGSTIGSAMPIAVSPFSGEIEALSDDVQEKMLSAMRAMVTALAQENHYRPELAVAMVDRQHDGLEFRDGAGRTFSCPKGQLLNLTQQDATIVPDGETAPLLAAGVANAISEVLEQVKLPNAPVTYFREAPADHFARWITQLGPLILAAGVILLVIEAVTPGFGAFGISGIVLLAVYFCGQYLAGLAGWEELALIIVGVILLAIEIFLIPGFGITGISGIACIVIGLILAFIPTVPASTPLNGLDAPTFLGQLPMALAKMLVTIVLAGGGVMLILCYLPHLPLLRGVILQHSLGTGNGAPPEEAAARQSLVGKAGIAITDLHPAGTAKIDGKRVDVLTSGAYVKSGAAIVVVAENGTGIVVEARD